MDLVIGLCLGVVSAVALAVMWRMVEDLRRDPERGDDPSDRAGPAQGDRWKDGAPPEASDSVPPPSPTQPRVP